jgi:hypothetical protein
MSETSTPSQLSVIASMYFAVFSSRYLLMHRPKVAQAIFHPFSLTRENKTKEQRERERERRREMKPLLMNKETS